MTNKNNKKEENKETNKKATRQIVIETDGNNIKIVKAEVTGSLEFKAILTSLMEYLNNK